MDAFRSGAEQHLQDLLYVPVTNQYNICHIRSSLTDDRDTKVEDLTLNDVDLRNLIDSSSATPTPDIGSTKVVHMFYHIDRGLKSAPSVFRHLWDSFHLDPYMVYMFSRNVPGFHQLPSASSAPPDNRYLTFYLNVQAHWVMWTYDSDNFSTNAIVLSRDTAGRPDAYPAVHAHLRRYASSSGHPLLLTLVFALERVEYIDKVVKDQHRRIGRAEQYTGFSHFYLNKPLPPIQDAEAKLAQLSDLSRIASSVLVALADMVQHLKCSETMLAAISSFELTPAMAGIDGIVRRDAEMKCIARLLQPQLKERYNYVDYIKQRAENQLTVIFNLLARHDAQATINIATATQHDSTSMKTIAVMTMGFLPATFWAALFSIPSLQWDQPKVISGRFWVYWAITIPTTLSVFAVWLAIVNCERISVVLRGLMGGGGAKNTASVREPPGTSDNISRGSGPRLKPLSNLA